MFTVKLALSALPMSDSFTANVLCIAAATSAVPNPNIGRYTIAMPSLGVYGIVTDPKYAAVSGRTSKRVLRRRHYLNARGLSITRCHCWSHSNCTTLDSRRWVKLRACALCYLLTLGGV